MTRGRHSNARNKPAKVPSPPDHLDPAEAAVWSLTCHVQNAEWLDTGPGPLLEEYCFAVVQLRKCRAQYKVEAASPDAKGRVSPEDLERIDALSRMVERLSRALRLTPQSRIRADKADNSPGNPWERGGPEDGDSD